MGSSSYGTLLICLQPSSSPLQTHTPGCQVAESMPFSSNKLPEILNRFSLKEKSAEAEIIKKELEVCEEPAMEGEARYCATSLESLIHFSTSKLGRNVNEVSTFTFLPSFEVLKWIRDSNDVAQYGFSFHGRLLTGL
ncbi:BURP domain protein RD22 [Vitis vinifera]|uniref:BURP domain protein RD22 n=1 Tax=Vitis vinifera TaxID=29760 RepID=A0A438FKJ8_VITVI|nr:BURP domain protein RD22 [Vitis vinifera]